MVIRIINHLRTWSSYSDGEVIFKLIDSAFAQGKSAQVSFFGIRSVPSAFINSALIRLLERYEFAFIRKNLQILDSTRQINSLIKDRFEFAARGQNETAPPA